MLVIRSLQDELTEEADVQRVIIPLATDLPVSAALIKVPPNHHFPFHCHPASEDTFFILSGSGEVFDPAYRYVVSEGAGVWGPPGVPHGLTSGSQGVIEIGFQSPVGPTLAIGDVSQVVVAEAGENTIQVSDGMAVDSVADSEASWQPIFPSSSSQTPSTIEFLQSGYCRLTKGETQTWEAQECDLLIVVAKGAIEIENDNDPVCEIAVVHLRSGETINVKCVEETTLVLAVQLLATAT